MVERNPPAPLRLRTVFISDIHLGFRGCSAELLLDFLHHVEMDRLFLVGDIVDVWSLRRSFYWPQIHNDVLRTILGKTKRGTRVIYVPGNHDEQLREICGSSFGNLEIHREYVHTTLQGLKLVIMHGDEFDGAAQCSRLLAAQQVGSRDRGGWIARANMALVPLHGEPHPFQRPPHRSPHDSAGCRVHNCAHCRLPGTAFRLPFRESHQDGRELFRCHASARRGLEPV